MNYKIELYINNTKTGSAKRIEEMIYRNLKQFGSVGISYIDLY